MMRIFLHSLGGKSKSGFFSKNISLILIVNVIILKIVLPCHLSLSLIYLYALMYKEQFIFHYLFQFKGEIFLTYYQHDEDKYPIIINTIMIRVPGPLMPSRPHSLPSPLFFPINSLIGILTHTKTTIRGKWSGRTVVCLSVWDWDRLV